VAVFVRVLVCVCTHMPMYICKHKQAKHQANFYRTMALLVTLLSVVVVVVFGSIVGIVAGVWQSPLLSGVVPCSSKLSSLCNCKYEWNCDNGISSSVAICTSMHGPMPPCVHPWILFSPPVAAWKLWETSLRIQKTGRS
jgi:hypothetical protein